MDTDVPVPTIDSDRSFTCACGRTYYAEPYRGRHAGHPRAPKHCAPKINPCDQCKPDPKQVAEEETRRRLRGAGIPDPLWRYHLDPARYISQGSVESDEAFLERVRRDPEGRAGVARANRSAFRAVADWLEQIRTGRHRNWLVLHGPPGTGKTALLAAIARGLLTTAPDQLVPLRNDELNVRREAGQRGYDYAAARGLDVRLKRGRTPPETRYMKASELGHQEGEGFEVDSGAVGLAKNTRVLLLDELGADAEPQKWELRAIESVLTKREEWARITVVASNRSPAELIEAKLYGHRVSSRLGAAVLVGVGGPSWRSA